MSEQRTIEPKASQSLREPTAMGTVLRELAEEAEILDARLNNALDRIIELESERCTLLVRLGKAEAELDGGAAA